MRRFHAQLLTDTSGAPIGSGDRAAWLKARLNGVTATDVGKIVKLNGHFSEQRAALLEAKLSGQEGPFLPAYQHGIDREPIIAAWVAGNYGIQPNSLLCRGDNPRHLATPDGIGAGVVAEIKTSTRPLDQALGTYRDQLQWQLYVTQSERLLFVVENRDTLQREARWIERDDYRILILAAHADAFIQELDERRAAARPSIATPAQQPAAGPVAPVPAAVGTASPGLPHAPASLSTAATTPAPAVTVENDVDETRPWNDAERGKLVAGYVGGATIAELATRVGTTHRAVVFELSRLWLKPEGSMVDPTAARFGAYWSSGEERTLKDLYSTGISLPNIARKMQRDQLGIAFRLFENHIPQLPAAPTTPAEKRKAHTSPTPEPSLPLDFETTNPAPPAPAPEAISISEMPIPAVLLPPKVAVQRQEVVLPPETIVGGLDPDNDSDDNRHWSPMELGRLLNLYGDNEDMEIFELARHFRTTSRAVVIALASIVLEPQGPLEDPHLAKRDWTQGDVDTVHDLFRAGSPLPQIAHATGRDQLSVAFRLLGDRLPEISGLIEEFQTA
ncbi:YqaJ viral recombinase family protein [Arthrobacter sp. TE12231]